MERKKIISMTISVFLLLVMVFTATYAYFSNSSINTTNVSNMNAVTPTTMSTFTSYSTNSLALSVGLEDLMTTSKLPVSDSGDLIVKLASPGADIQMSCTYDIRYVWDTTAQYTTPTMTLNSTYPYELSISGTASSSGDSFSSYNYSSKNRSETDLSTLTWTGNAGTVGRYATLVSGAKIYSNTTTGTTVTWTFNLNFYTLPSNQATFAGKSMGGHLIASNIVC